MPAETHSHRTPLRRDEIGALVRDQLAEILAVDEHDVTADARLRADLGADDYALIDLAVAIEAELAERTVGFSLGDDDLAEAVTVGDLVDSIAAQLGGRHGEPA